MKNKAIFAVYGAIAALPLVLGGCPKNESGGGGAPSASASATTATTTADQPTASSSAAPDTSAKKTTTLPIIPLHFDGGMFTLDGGALPVLDAGPIPIPSASASGSSSAQPAAMPPECTQYLAKADACNAKRPPALQGPAKATVAAQRAAWQSALGSGQAASVAGQCKAASAALALDPACK